GRGADAGAAFGSGSSGSIFGARGPTSFLAKITGLLAAIFFTTSLSLAYLAGQSVERRSVVERAGQPSAPTQALDLPAAAGAESDLPAAPGAGGGTSDLPDNRAAELPAKE
ncbi:MAG: preprotein translocase subunit SecG, partial [Gammaproteobacteria bacterium]